MDREERQNDDNRNTSDETFLSVAKDFCGYTSAHGPGRLKDAKSWLQKFCWSSLFIAAVVILCIQVHTSYNKYQSRPLATRITLESTTILPFPVVTLCNFNAIRYDALLRSNFSDLIEKLITQNVSLNASSPSSSRGHRSNGDPTSSPITENGDDYDNPERWDDFGEDGYKEPHNLDPKFLAREIVAVLLAQKGEAVLSQLGHQFEDMVLSCTYRGIPCSNFTSRFWTTFWHYKHGNCFVFNSGLTRSGTKTLPMMSNKAGPSHGLSLEINIQQDQYLDKFTPGAGIKVEITNQGEMPFPQQLGLSFTPGFVSTIGLKKIMIKREDPFNDNRCYKSSSMDESNLYAKKFKVSYTSTACKESCLAYKQKMRCGCIEYRFPVADTLVCNITNKATISCLNNVQKLFQENQLNCTEACPPPCRQEEFKLSTSFAAWPSERYEKFYKDELRKRGKYMWTDSSSNRKNLLKLHVFYEELDVEVISEHRSYELSDFAADIGGQLGLWIGFSVLTIAEFLEFAFLLIRLAAKKCLGGKKEKTSAIELG